VRLRWPKWIVIEGCRDKRPLLTRYVLWDNGKKGGLFLHVFWRSDEDRELHDHPWDFLTWLLWAGYTEELEGGRRVRRWPLSILFRRAEHSHRVEIPEGKIAVTLVLAFPKRRDWGFWCADGWKLNTDYGKERECPGR
jgi:hypothetical protein